MSKQKIFILGVELINNADDVKLDLEVFFSKRERDERYVELSNQLSTDVYTRSHSNYVGDEVSNNVDGYKVSALLLPVGNGRGIAKSALLDILHEADVVVNGPLTPSFQITVSDDVACNLTTNHMYPKDDDLTNLSIVVTTPPTVEVKGTKEELAVYYKKIAAKTKMCVLALRGTIDSKPCDILMVHPSGSIAEDLMKEWRTCTTNGRISKIYPAVFNTSRVNTLDLEVKMLLGGIGTKDRVSIGKVRKVIAEHYGEASVIQSGDYNGFLMVLSGSETKITDNLTNDIVDTEHTGDDFPTARKPHVSDVLGIGADIPLPPIYSGMLTEYTDAMNKPVYGVISERLKGKGICVTYLAQDKTEYEYITKHLIEIGDRQCSPSDGFKQKVMAMATINGHRPEDHPKLEQYSGRHAMYKATSDSWKEFCNYRTLIMASTELPFKTVGEYSKWASSMTETVMYGERIHFINRTGQWLLNEYLDGTLKTIWDESNLYNYDEKGARVDKRYSGGDDYPRSHRLMYSDSPDVINYPWLVIDSRRGSSVHPTYIDARKSGVTVNVDSLGITLPLNSILDAPKNQLGLTAFDITGDMLNANADGMLSIPRSVHGCWTLKNGVYLKGDTGNLSIIISIGDTFSVIDSLSTAESTVVIHNALNHGCGIGYIYKAGLIIITDKTDVPPPYGTEDTINWE